jgi:hypothetical protein
MNAYWGSTGIAPRILDLGIRWRRVVSFTPWPLYPRERAPSTHWIGGWVGPRAVPDAVVKRKIPSPRRKSNPRTPIVQPVVQRYTNWAIPAIIYIMYICIYVCTYTETSRQKFLRSVNLHVIRWPWLMYYVRIIISAWDQLRYRSTIIHLVPIPTVYFGLVYDFEAVGTKTEINSSLNRFYSWRCGTLIIRLNLNKWAHTSFNSYTISNPGAWTVRAEVSMKVT